MSYKVFEYDLQIKEGHLDSFGHVNNAVYVQLYEEARWDFITKNGHGLDVVLKEKKGPVLLDMSVRFRREIKNREHIKIRSQVKEIKNSKIMVLEQVMIKTDGKTASEALFTIGFFDTQERKLIDCSDEWLIACGVKE